MIKPEQILKEYFGYHSFRPLQRDIIEHVLSGQDALVIMPTGGGKSICYQIPALMMKGTTLVVSPLISLMKDQVDALRVNGVEAAFFNSSITDFEKSNLIDSCTEGKIKLLYMSPESLMLAAKTWLKDVPVNFLVVDEAHCVSMWGHDFRPEYQQIHLLRQVFPNAAMLALTATADKVTRGDIAQKLQLKNHHLFLASFERENLSLSVRPNIPKRKKEEEILRFIQERQDEAGIYYCLSRRETEEWSTFFNSHGIPSKYYHAGLPATQRDEIQNGFIRDEYKVICATIAFGMGIDKSNVRWIIHNNLPKNIEGYYQEIGRAGRDGMNADTVMYYNYRDVIMLRDFIQESEFKEVYLDKIKRMLNYAEALTCRRNIILSYFGELRSDNCGNCDNCTAPPALFDGTIITQMAISALLRLKENVGLNTLINVLRGSKNAEIMENKFHEIKTYGAGKEYSFVEWQHFLNQIINQGYLEIAYDKHMNLQVTDLGREVIAGKQSVKIGKYVEAEKVKKTKKEKLITGETNFSFDLLAELKKWRKQIALENSVPAYVILHDSTINEINQSRPQNLEDLSKISGMGKNKIERFGEDLIRIVNAENISKSNSKISTFDQTLELYKQNYSVEEIAEKRNLNIETIYNHLARLFEDGKPVDLNKYVTEYEVSQVKETRKKLNNTQQLKPIYEALNESLEYRKIGLALTILNSQQRFLAS